MASFTNVGKQIDPIVGQKPKGIAGLNVSPIGSFATPVGTAQPGKTGSSGNFLKGKGAGLLNAGMGLFEGGIELAAINKLDPSYAESRAQVKRDVKAKNKAMVKTGLQTGASVGGTVGSFFGPIGTAIGTVGGAIVGGAAGLVGADLQKGKAIKKFNERANEENTADFYEDEQERLQNYLDTTNSDRIKKEIDLVSQSQGYFT